MQWNILADGLASDGFLVRGKTKTVEEEDARIKEVMAKVKAAREIKDKEAKIAEMEKIGKEFSTPEEEALLDDVVNWEKRWPRMREVIEKSNPDVLVLMEVDHMKQLEKELGDLGYACGFPNKTYQPIWEATFENSGVEFDIFPDKKDRDKWRPARDSVTDYLEHLDKTGVAFVPKTRSNCRKFGKKRNPNADNDGVAIFWKEDRYTLSNLSFLAYDDEKRNEGIVRVDLIGHGDYHMENLSVIGGHLTSGDDQADELQRMREVLEPTLERCGEKTGPSLREFFEEATIYGPTILAVDANTYPDKDEDQTAWKALRSLPGVKCCWDEYYYMDGKPKLDDALMPVTSNKMRGPLSDQPKKIGDHVYHTVDHIFCSESLELVPGSMVLEDGKDGIDLPQVLGGKEEAQLKLLPSFEIPSDHAPVVADFKFKDLYFESSVRENSARESILGNQLNRAAGGFKSVVKLATLDPRKSMSNMSTSARSTQRKTKTLSVAQEAATLPVDREAQRPQALWDPRMEPVVDLCFSAGGSMIASVMQGAAKSDNPEAAEESSDTIGGHLRVHKATRFTEYGGADAAELIWPARTRLPIVCVTFSPQITLETKVSNGEGMSNGEDKGQKRIYYDLIALGTSNGKEGELLFYTVTTSDSNRNDMPIITNALKDNPCVTKAGVTALAFKREEDKVGETEELTLVVGFASGGLAIYKITLSPGEVNSLMPKVVIGENPIDVKLSMKATEGSSKRAIAAMCFLPIPPEKQSDGHCNNTELDKPPILDSNLLLVAGNFSEIVMLDIKPYLENTGAPADCSVMKLNYGAFVDDLVCSPSGNLIAAGGYANDVKVWERDVEGNKAVEDPFCILRHDGPVHSVAFHPTANILISGGNGRKMFIWDLDNFQVLHAIALDKAVQVVRFEPREGLYIASGCSPDIASMDNLALHHISAPDAGKLLTVKDIQKTKSLQLSHDASLLAICYGNVLTILDTHTERPLHEALKVGASVTCLCFGPNAFQDRRNKMMLVAVGCKLKNGKGKIVLFNACAQHAKATRLDEVETDMPVASLAFPSELLVRYEKSQEWQNVQEHMVMTHSKNKKNVLTQVVTSATKSKHKGQVHGEVVLAVGTVKEETTHQPEGDANLLCFVIHTDPNGMPKFKTLDAKIHLGGLESRKGKPPRQGADKTAPIDVKMNNEGSLVAVARDFDVILYEVFKKATEGEDKKGLKSLAGLKRFNGVDGGLKRLNTMERTFQPYSNGRSLPGKKRSSKHFKQLVREKHRTTLRNMVQVMRDEAEGKSDTQMSKVVAKLSKNRRASALASTEGRLKNLGMGGKTVVKGDTVTLKHLDTLAHEDYVQCVCFNVADSHNNRSTVLATGACSSEVRLYDVATGEIIRKIRIGNWVTAVCFSSGSRLLAIGGRDNNIHVHDTFTGEEIFELGHDGWVQALSFAEHFPAYAHSTTVGTGVQILASVDKNDKVKLWPQVGSVMAKVAVAFWAQPPSPMSVPVHLPNHMLHFITSPSGRTMLCHAAAIDNFDLVYSLLNDKPEEVLTCALTRRDISGKNALDYALANRNERSLRAILSASAKVPPRARQYVMCNNNNKGVPIFIDELCKHFPTALLDYLNEIDLDPYEDYDGCPSLTRVPAIYFKSDEPDIACKGWPSTSPPQGHVVPPNMDDQSLKEDSSTVADNEDVKPDEYVISQHGIWTDVLLELCKDETICYSAECRIVGVPQLLSKPPKPKMNKFCEDLAEWFAEWGGGDTKKDNRQNKATTVEDIDLFESIVTASKRSSEASPIISTKVMRAAIAFKWRTYGQRRWMYRFAEFVVYFVSYNASLGILARSAPGDSVEWHVAGIVLLCIALLCGLHYLLLEVLQFLAQGLIYFTNLASLNLFDFVLLSLQIVVSTSYLNREYYYFTGDRETQLSLLGPSVDLSDNAQDYQRENLLNLGSAGAALLTFTRFMQVARGSNSLSYLLLMFREIIYDMKAFIVVMVVFMITCSTALLILTHETHMDYDSGLDALLSSYFVPMMGSFSRTAYTNRFSIAVVLVYFTLLANIVMLNMLIAIMAETYTKCREGMEDRQLRERAFLILDEQDQKVAWDKVKEIFGFKEKQSEWFPEWLHCIVKNNYSEDEKYSKKKADARVVRRDEGKGREGREQHMAIMQQKLEEMAETLQKGTRSKGRTSMTPGADQHTAAATKAAGS